jgi:hypothetical protein
LNTFEVHQNYLSSSFFEELQHLLLSDLFPWYYNKKITGKEQSTTTGRDFMFTHTLIHKGVVNSDWGEVITKALMEKVSYDKIIRAKINCYSSTEELIKHEFHRDSEQSVKVGLFYLNTNNGYTEFENNQKVESKENQMLFFDGKHLHRSTNCTDEKVRITININYT